MKSNLSQVKKTHPREFFAAGAKMVKAARSDARKTSKRLYAKAVITGYQRSCYKQRVHTNILRIQGVNCVDDTTFYLGKRVVFIYRAKTEKNGSTFRVVWGKVTRSHGNKGSVRAKFSKNLPPSAHSAQETRGTSYKSYDL